MAGETELKLLLPGADPATLQRLISRLPPLARRPHHQEQLLNRYYDTPDGDLQRGRAALRLRRVGAAGQRARWIQTFKTAGVSVGGMSVRGEWEAPVRAARLQRSALGDAPWDALDPHGQIWAQLVPVFETHCTRTLWTVRRRNGSVIEVALDVGDIRAAGQSLPLCELELELKAGDTAALFELASQLATHLAVLPGQASKAERGYALLLGDAHAPVLARPPTLSAAMPVQQAGAAVCAEMWDQLLRNLALLPHSNNPEVVHQARVGWRRLRSALRLFRPLWGRAPALGALGPLWAALGTVRDLDVLVSETLPRWREAFSAGDARRAGEWDALAAQVLEAAAQARQVARAYLADPAVGQAWLSLAQWLAQVSAAHPLANPPADTPADTPALGPWATRRLARWQHQLQRARRQMDTDTGRHRVRLLAKRLRYGAQALSSVLPAKAGRWAQKAARLQTRLGAERDLDQAVVRLFQMGLDGAPLAFLRGVASARKG